MKLIATRRASAAEADPLESFGSELAERQSTRPSLNWSPLTRWIVIGVAVLIPASAALGMVLQRRWAARPAVVTVTIESTPSGADVLVGGASRGRAPLTLQVAPSSQSIEVVHGTDRIPVQINAAAGSVVTQHVVFSQTAAPATAASLVVSTNPARLKVSVDDVARGLSPATISGLPPGAHRVRVGSGKGETERSVDLQSGQTLSLVLDAPSAAPVSAAATGGWLTVASAIPLQLSEGGQVIGTSAAARIMLPAGTHDLEAVNEELGFRARRKVRVTAGAVSAIRFDLPKAPLSMNAIPWADVTVDAQHVGETPIGNYSVSIGRHEVIYRHPELGERRQTVIVGLKSPARVTMNFTAK